MLYQILKKMYSSSFLIIAFSLPFFLLLIFVFVPSISRAESPVMVLKEKTYDFGEVTQGQILKHKFLFKNTGDGVLIISKLKPG